MTRAVLPQMKSRKKGAIVNIGSAAATVAPSGPLYAIYAGTKVRSMRIASAQAGPFWLWQADVHLFWKPHRCRYLPSDTFLPSEELKLLSV